MPAGVGDTREAYEQVFGIYWPIGVGVFVLIVVALCFVVLRFRSSSRELPQGKDESKAEEAYALLVGLIVAGLLLVTYAAMSDIPVDQTASGDTGRPAGSELIEVTAARWRWRFDYPEHGITEVGTERRSPTLTIPTDTPIYFRLTSLDVVHAFWIPERRFKMDAFPRRTTTFTLLFPEAAFWRGGGQCAQYCGLLHKNMEFNVRALPPAEFDEWVGGRS